MFRRAIIPISLFFLAMPPGLAAQSQALGPGDLSGLQARNIGPAVMSGRIVDLAVVEMDPTVFYVASSTGGLWKTTNNAVTFTPLFGNEPVHSIGDVAVHQVDTSLVWVGTGERANRQSSGWGDGVYLSRDGGQSWENVGLEDSRHIGRIALHPTDPEVVYVAAMGHLWGPNEETGPLQKHRWRLELGAYPLRGRGHGGRRRDPGSGKPRDRVCRILPASTPPIRLPRRRTGERPLEVRGRRRELDQAHQFRIR